MILKNNNVLDFLIPYFHYLHTLHLDFKVDIIYCDFVGVSLPSSELNIDIKKNINVTEYRLNPFFGITRVRRKSNRINYFYIMKFIPTRLINKMYIRGFENLRQRITNSVIFLDDTSSDNGTQRNNLLLSVLTQISNLMFLTPHAPHFSPKYNPRTMNTIFSNLLQKENCYRIQPLKCYLNSSVNNEKNDIWVGYPGFDEKWIQYVSNFQEDTKRKKKNILIIIRKFKTTTSSPESFEYSLSEFTQIIVGIFNLINSYLPGHTIVIKPHPSNNLKLISQVLKQNGFYDFSITNESLYDSISKSKAVFSMYSTATFYGYFAQKPVFFVKNTISKFVQENDKCLNNLYSNITYYDLEIESDVNEIKQYIRSNSFDNEIINSLRDFYPNNASKKLDLIVNSLYKDYRYGKI